MTTHAVAPWRDGAALAGAALALRVGVALWAGPRFPPAHDGAYYHVVAQRIAAGHGYTWAWPDGAVTHAAHYPVGYPAMLGAAYAGLGSSPLVAMLLNAILGAAAVLGAHRLVALHSRSAAAVAAGAVAMHPGLVLYTGALMTEGAVAGLLVTAAAFAARCAAARRRVGWLVALGVTLGVATLFRPQVVVVAPAFGAIALAGARLRGAVAATALAVATCAPWTLRNCQRMGQCLFVSANGGWNLLIGAGSSATGTWVPIESARESAACADVFDEARKDSCFAAQGRRAIVGDPLRWLRLVPAKLSATFDAGGAAAWYLHASNPAAFSAQARDRWALADAAATRVVVVLGLIALARQRGPRRRFRIVAAAAGALSAASPWGWPAWLAVVASSVSLGRALASSPLPALSATVVAALAATHAVFFGAGRYALTAVPVLAALAGTALTLPHRARDTSLEESA